MPKQKGKKSHHGCSECKRRSVKCDEKRPKCSHCEKRRSGCNYASPGPFFWTGPTGADVPISRPEAVISDSQQEIPRHQNGINNPQQPTNASPPPSPSPSPIYEFNTHHLRLLLTWTTSTSHSISRTPADAPIWQRTIPERALSCPYLLHGIFAVSALHLALSPTCKVPEKQSLIEAASHHQSAAIAMFTREGVDLANLRLESFALSALLIGAAFAFPLAVAAPSTPGIAGASTTCAIDELVEVFLLSRKMITYLAPAMHGLQRSELSAFFLLDDVDGVSNLSPESQHAIKTLHELVDETYPESQTHPHHAIYTSTIARLATLLGKLDGGGEMISNSFNWINEVPDGYIELLRAHEPLALVVLAHFCVVLFWLKERWWVATWGERVFKGVLEGVGERWRAELGWVVGVFEGG